MFINLHLSRIGLPTSFCTMILFTLPWRRFESCDSFSHLNRQISASSRYAHVRYMSGESAERDESRRCEVLWVTQVKCTSSTVAVCEVSSRGVEWAEWAGVSNSEQWTLYIIFCGYEYCNCIWKILLVQVLVLYYENNANYSRDICKNYYIYLNTTYVKSILLLLNRWISRI